MVEIALDAGRLPVDLIADAYLASRTTTIGFVLGEGVVRDQVDAVLDPLVATTCSTVRGVLYLDYRDRLAVLTAIRQARIVVAATQRFGEQCARAGVVSLDWTTALPGFESLAGQHSPAQIRLATGSDLQSVRA